MTVSPSVLLRDVTVRFPLSFDRMTTLKARAANLARRVISPQRAKRSIRQFEALRGVTLNMREGDVVGVVGPNGSGKTTLLRVVAGIYHPDAGHVETVGNISTLLSLGTGFDNNLTGRENIRIAGRLMGLSAGEVKRRTPEIVEYAELDDFMDVPLKFYSNGMISRLGFSIVVAMDPDILLIDEIFAVGDLSFRRKSEQTLDNLLRRTQCQLIVTHNLDFVRNHCNRAIYLSGGELVADGEPAAVLLQYQEDARRPRADSRLGSGFVFKS